MAGPAEIAERYRRFAVEQADGVSPSLAGWARAVAADSAALRRLSTLPLKKQQPNLVFAAARWHGAVPGEAASLRRVLRDDWVALRGTIEQRDTQTNEPARCAALLVGLNKVAGPISLIELGASAGLCLIPDRYTYRFRDSVLDPDTGPSPVRIECPAWPDPPRQMPHIAWRRGLDLNPLSAVDPDTRAWLRTLIWPEQDDRLRRLDDALDLAASQAPVIEAGDFSEHLASLIATAPAEGTVVVMHSAALAYVDEAIRVQVVRTVAAAGARRLSFEGRGVDPQVDLSGEPPDPRRLFVAALDGAPYGFGDGHGGHLVPSG